MGSFHKMIFIYLFLKNQKLKFDYNLQIIKECEHIIIAQCFENRSVQSMTVRCRGAGPVLGCESRRTVAVGAQTILSTVQRVLRRYVDTHLHPAIILKQ